MKRLTIICALLLSAAFANANNVKPFVIPEVKEWEGGEGTLQKLSGKICVPEGNKDLMEIAAELAADLRTAGHGRFKVTGSSAKDGDIVLGYTEDGALGREGYTMEVGTCVRICAAERTGAYWATRTLLQMMEQGSLPCGKISDSPEYGLRGFMIDCGRKYIPIDYLRNLVKVMAYYKMNTLQVHLNDNGFVYHHGNDWDKTYAAFRLESEKFPGLGAADGYYTKDDFRLFQKEAAAVGVDIIPEIDAPAHVLAFSHYKPSLGSEKYGPDHFDLFNPEVYEFMDELWKEYLEGDDPVFVGKRVHVGTDEYSNKDQEVVEKFRYYTDRYIRYVESFGKQAIAWGALSHAAGETPVKSEGVIMSEWYNGYADPVKMREDGYDMISVPDGWVYIVPAAGYYYDYLDIKDLYNNWTPAHIGEEVFEENDPQILGGMFAEWNDHCGNGISVSDIHHRTMPAMQTLSAKCWSGARSIIPFEEFDARKEGLSEAPGVNELGRIKEPFTIKRFCRWTRCSQDFVGYGHKVSFTLKARKEKPGTILSTSSRSTFYLSDPENGKLGFSRDGYLYTFDYAIEPGTTHRIGIEMTNESTKLYVDGELREELGIETWFNDEAKKRRMERVRTLVFPTAKAGKFRSSVRNLTVE